MKTYLHNIKHQLHKQPTEIHISVQKQQNDTASLYFMYHTKDQITTANVCSATKCNLRDQATVGIS